MQQQSDLASVNSSDSESSARQQHEGTALLPRVKAVVSDFGAFVTERHFAVLLVSFAISTTFQQLVASFLADLLMPLIGAAIGQNFQNVFVVLRDGKSGNRTYSTRQDALNDQAVILSIGNFILALETFALVLLCMYVFTKIFQRLAHEKKVENEKPCTYCRKPIDMQATRCPFCTSQLNA